MNFTLRELKFLGSFFANSNPLGFFNNIKAELEGDEEELLKGKGVLADGRVEDSLADILKTAADPEKCARLVLETPFLVVEKYTYRKGDRLVLLENRMGDVGIEPLDSLEPVMAELIHFTGLSDIKNAGIDVVLDKEETLAFLSLIDWRRRQAMGSYWGEREEKEEVAIGEIAGMMQSLLPNSLLKMMVNNYRYELPPRDKIPLIMQRLEEKGVIDGEANGGIYKLKGQYALLGQLFLLPRSIAVLEMLINDKKEGLISSGCLLVSAGLYDNLLFMFDEDSIRISTVTSRTVLEIMEEMLMLK